MFHAEDAKVFAEIANNYLRALRFLASLREPSFNFPPE